MPDLMIRVRRDSPEWHTLGEVLHTHVGAWREYEVVVAWFQSQKARFVPQADQALKYYNLEFDSQEDLMEFVLKWL
jgi:hypothetical protein